MSTNLLRQSVSTPSWELDSSLLVTGVSYRNTCIESRERLALVGPRYHAFMDSISSHSALQGAVVLTTCNRTEVVTASNSDCSPIQLHQQVLDVWKDISGIRDETIDLGGYRLSQLDAVEHVFRVASGLDSMILGEPQVLGQMKDAFRNSCDCGATGFLLQRLFQQAFSVAKRIRAETNISRLPVSVAYAAKVLCEHIFGELSDARVVLIGAGDTAALMLRHLGQAGVTNFTVANRTLVNAQPLVEEFGARLASLDELPSLMSEADILVSAVSLSADSGPVVMLPPVAEASAKRRGRPQLFVDLGVPRNIDGKISDLPDVFLYNVDDLQSVVETNAQQRQSAAQEAEGIVKQEAVEFLDWVNSRRVHETIRDARRRIHAFEEVELEKSIRRLRRSGFSEQQCAELASVLRDYSDGVVSKVLHQPFRRMRECGSENGAHLDQFSQYFLDDLDQQTYRSHSTKGKKIGNS